MPSDVKLRYLAAFLAGVNITLFLHQTLSSKVSVDVKSSRPESDMMTFTDIVSQGLTDSPSKISRILHLTWKNEFLPRATETWVKQWLKYAPGWKYVLWTDRAARRLIELKYPDYLPLYDDYPKPIYRADAVRYFILHEYGGVYADLDVEPLRDINSIRDKYACVLSQEPDEHSKFLNTAFSDFKMRIACNAFMACRPKHPFFYNVIRNLHHHHRTSKRFHHEPGRTIISTGPAMLTTMFNIYQKNSREHVKEFPEDEIMLADADEFTPTFDGLELTRVKLSCKRHQYLLPSYSLKVCDNFKKRNFTNLPSANSYTDHHWHHTWLGTKKKTQSGVHVKDVLPGVVIADDLEQIENKYGNQ